MRKSPPVKGLGPHDLWQVKAPFGVELSIWRSHVTPESHIGKVCAYTRDLDHILFHLPFAIAKSDRFETYALLPAPRTWHVVRQDDHGTRYDVRAFTSSEVSQALCCIEYVCPANGYDTMGCKGGTGHASINGAFKACNAHCPGSCSSSGLLCDPI